LFPGNIDAADGCNYLSGVILTLAAALLMIFSLSIIEFITMSLKVDLLAGGKRSQRNA
jgi:hypothetical protein